MAGSVSTLRVSGLPSGYPAEIDANVKIRWVDEQLVNMSEQSADLLKMLGGPAQFVFTNPKVEWVEDDQWGRRPTHGGLAADVTTALTVTGQAHRFPIGTLFLHVPSGEIVRVTAIADADTLTLQRDVQNLVTEGAWASTDEVIVAGHAMSEDENWTFRPSAILGLPFNYAQVSHVGVQATFRRVATALYGLTGTDLDYQSAAVVAQQFVYMEQELLSGKRFVGASTARPATSGGVAQYVTAANGADVTDLSGAPLTRKDFEDMLQDIWYSVGPEKMAKDVAISYYGQRKVDSWFSGSERLTQGATGTGGVHMTSVRFNGIVLNFMVHTAVAKNDAWLLNRNSIKMGHFAGLGKPHLLQLAAPSATGPRIQRAYYRDTSVLVKGVQGMGKLEEFSIAA